MNNVINVAFAGNPNCGKTTLFNAYTGAKLKVANWPGVTVEKKEGAFKFHENQYKLVDLPGIYSLTSFTMEEKLSREYILSDDVDVIINVVDASSLERNLYLTLQLLELGKPVVIALNMMDILEQRGIEIDLHRMTEMLGVPVIPVSARKRRGLDSLMHAVAHHKDIIIDKIEHQHEKGKHMHHHHDEFVVVYSDDVEDKIDIIIGELRKNYPDVKNLRWHAIKILEKDEVILNKYPINPDLINELNIDSQIINQKYDFIEEVIEETLINREKKIARTEKIDSILTNKYLGIPIFLAIIALVFFLTFTVGDFLKGYFETSIEWITEVVKAFLTNINAGELIISLIVDGIIAGVGGILTFLPNIFILFLALALLEDSGYMSRVAYIMNDVMEKIGLSGRAFIPMLLGFGCTVPAVMASRALEDPRDRLKTILVTPFMSCSAKLPVYVLLSEIFFGSYAMLAAYSMYIIGLIMAIIIALIMSKLETKKEINSLLIELPEYKAPSKRTVAIFVWEKVKDYLTRAGTVIFVASVILWLLQNFNFNGLTSDSSDSIAAYIGKFITPVFIPCGLGMWQIVVALISGLAAKEVVAASLGVLFGIENIFSGRGMATLQQALANMGFGPLNAYSLMLFTLLYVPCFASIATIKKETGSVKWTAYALLMQLSTAYIVSLLFYQIASLIVR